MDQPRSPNQVFSITAFNSTSEEDAIVNENEYFDKYYKLDKTGASSHGNRIGRYLNANPESISLSLALPKDAIALLHVRTSGQKVPYDCRNVPQALYLDSILSKINAELKISFENPTKNVIIKATDRKSGLVVGYCSWGFAGYESRVLEDRAKLDIRSPEGYDRAWLKKYMDAFGDLESTTIPEGDCILLMQMFVMAEYHVKSIGTRLLEWGLHKADVAMKPVHTISSPKTEGLCSVLGFKSLERRELLTGLWRASAGSRASDARTLCAMIRQPVSAEEWQEQKETEEARASDLEIIEKESEKGEAQYARFGEVGWSERKNRCLGRRDRVVSVRGGGEMSEMSGLEKRRAALVLYPK